MAFVLTIEGTILDQNTDPVVGMAVVIAGGPGGITTNASGFYQANLSSDTYGSGEYEANPSALAPHYADPGIGPGHMWNAATNVSYTDDFTSTVSNNAPTTDTLANQSYTTDTGSQTLDGNMADADAGDVMTPNKTAGAAWGTLAKISATVYRWTFDTTGVAPGNYDFSYTVTDDWGGTSATDTLTVTIVSGNTAPTLDAVADKEYQIGTGDFTFALNAFDAEGLPANPYSKVTGPAFATVNTITGVVTVDSEAGSVGDHFFTWRVTDNGGLTADASHTIKIRPMMLVAVP